LIDDINWLEQRTKWKKIAKTDEVINDITVLKSNPTTIEEPENVIDDDLIEIPENDPLYTQDFVISSVVSLNQMQAPPPLSMITKKTTPPSSPFDGSLKSSSTSSDTAVESLVQTLLSPSPSPLEGFNETPTPAPSRLKVKPLEQLLEPALKRSRIDSPVIEPLIYKPSVELPTNHMDEDYYFLISLHPHLRRLEESQRLKIKMNIQRMIYNGLYEKNIG
jgi:hypothetical protein